MDAFVGEIRIFAGNFVPRGWAACNGALLSIQQNTALFSILGVQYGGNGTTTFGLPDFQGRAPVHRGQGNGLSSYVNGQKGGTPSVTLLPNTLPQHSHTLRAAPRPAGSPAPTPAGGTLLGVTAENDQVYANPVANPVAMSPSGTSLVGGGGAHNNMQPYLGISFIICVQGEYPQRP